VSEQDGFVLSSSGEVSGIFGSGAEGGGYKGPLGILGNGADGGGCDGGPTGAGKLPSDRRRRLLARTEFCPDPRMKPEMMHILSLFPVRDVVDGLAIEVGRGLYCEIGDGVV